MESKALDIEKRFLIPPGSENLCVDEQLIFILFYFLMKFAFLAIAVVASRRCRRAAFQPKFTCLFIFIIYFYLLLLSCLFLLYILFFVLFLLLLIYL